MRDISVSGLIAELCVIHNDPRFKLGWIEQTSIKEACKLLADFQRFTEWVRKAPVESGVCCCGDVLAAHSQNIGHPFTDQWDRSLSNWLKELDL